MEWVMVIAFFGAMFWIMGKYYGWLRRSVATRIIETSLSADELRRIFDQTVAKMGWKIVDTGNPRVAQSSLMAGMRQQISLTIKAADNGKQVAVVTVPRLVVKMLGRVPTKAHTLRIRMNAFTEAVKAADRNAHVALQER